MRTKSDPTRREMVLFLGRRYKRLDREGWRDDAEIAIHWFATNWHGGQNSNLYSALSTSYYSPRYATEDGDRETGSISDMMDALEAEYFGDYEEFA